LKNLPSWFRYALGAYLPVYFSRAFPGDNQAYSLWNAVIICCGGALSSWTGGVVADRAGRWTRRWEEDEEEDDDYDGDDDDDDDDDNDEDVADDDDDDVAAAAAAAPAPAPAADDDPPSRAHPLVPAVGGLLALVPMWASCGPRPSPSP
jgi:hypothetical protein